MNPAPTFDPGFSTPAMAGVFSFSARVQTMCRVEAALARAAADAGLIAAELAAEIETAASVPVADPERILAAGWEAGSPVIVLLEQLRSRLTPEAAASLHLGATTQDIVDSAAMVQIREGAQLLLVDLGRIAGALRRLADEHRSTAMIGRTFLQQARPTTFGLRAAQWLDPVARLIVDGGDLVGRLPVQLGGPVGTMATFGGDADAVAEGFAARLGLAVPTIPWHTDRTALTEVAGFVQRIAGSAAKIGTDLALLSQPEIGEVRIRSGGSSAMPGKQNPIDAVRAVAAAEACIAAAAIMTAGHPHELERAVGAWHAEWFAIPVAFQTAAAALDAIARAVESIEVDPVRMADNLGAPIDGDTVAAASRLIDKVLVAVAALEDRA